MESQENKAFLWNLMTQNGLFQDINSNYYQMVKDEFETTIPLIEGKFGNSMSLLDKNKAFLSDMVARLKKFKGEGMYTAQQMREANQSQFQNALSSHEANFQQAIQPPAPKEVSFADPETDIDGPIDMAAMLEQKQRERNLDIDIGLGLNSGVVHTDAVPGNTSKDLATSSPTPVPLAPVQGPNENQDTTNSLLQKILENQAKIFERLENLERLERLEKREASSSSKPQEEQI
jgi:hypothetical protein